jgi:hypothetical protein
MGLTAVSAELQVELSRGLPEHPALCVDLLLLDLELRMMQQRKP